VLGKLAAALAPPEPQLQHAALRLSGRGWETLPLRAPDGSGALVVALDLHGHHAVAEHSDGRAHHIPLAPDRPVGAVTREVLAAVSDLVGPVPFDAKPQETPWTTPLDEDVEHTTYNPTQVTEYFAAATHAALVLAALRAPYRGRSTPVNAWWGTFDFAVSLFSGEPVDPPSQDFITRNSANAQQIEVGLQLQRLYEAFHRLRQPELSNPLQILRRRIGRRRVRGDAPTVAGLNAAQ